MAATAEIISIGTELLLGDVLDTNSQYFATELARLGINCYYRNTVGDNKERIQGVLRTALSRSDIVITSGGLGPTVDDLTTESIAEFFQAETEIDEEVVSRIATFFKLRGVEMPVTNRKQALKPKDAEWLNNPTGTAPGIIWKLTEPHLRRAGLNEPERSRTILTFPGVPSELKRMWQETAAPYLERFVDGTIWSCELKHYGIGESALAEQFGHLMDSPNPTVAPYAGRGECRLRVTAKAETVAQAKLIAAPVIEEIRQRSGHLCYGVDKETLESVVGTLLTQRQMSLSVAESCTGGMVSKRLTDIDGSSRYVKLNVVTYANQAKTKLLRVPESLINQHGAVSAQCARAMAKGVRSLGEADLGLSITGIAGPGGFTDDKPVGLVHFSLAGKGFCTTNEVRFSNKLSRDEIRFRSANEALNMVRIYLIAPETFVNEQDEEDLKIDYRITITRGPVAQFKRCRLSIRSLAPEAAKKLTDLVQSSGILGVEQGFVERASELVKWVLTVTDDAGSHQITGKTGVSVEDQVGLDVTELLNFLNPYLEEWSP